MRDCDNLGDLQMLASLGDANGVDRHAVDEAGKRRREANDERDHTAPVGGVAGGVAVHAVEVVHVGHGDVAATGDVVAA
jgi:hypothetical protein